MISILVLGDCRRREFAAARASLDAAGWVVDAASIDEAIASVDAGGLGPAVVVIAQSYPGEFSAESLDRLRRRVPLARFVGLLGSWCEGESRSGHPWPGVIRLYWHQWIPRAVRELAELAGGSGSTWALPNTATDEERLLAGSSRPLAASDGLVVLCVDRSDTHDWRAAAIRRQGFSTAWLRPGQTVRLQGVRAALLDASSGGDSEMTRLRQLSKNLGANVPVIAMLDFPRIEDHLRAEAAGAAAVLSKPVLLDDLFWQLDQVTAEGWPAPGQATARTP